MDWTSLCLNVSEKPSCLIPLFSIVTHWFVNSASRVILLFCPSLSSILVPKSVINQQTSREFVKWMPIPSAQTKLAPTGNASMLTCSSDELVPPVLERVLEVAPHRVRATVRFDEIPSVTSLLPRHAFSGTDSGCGSPQDLSEESGTFSSMNYPNKYDNGRRCTWHITVDPDKVTRTISGLQKRTVLCLAKSWGQTFGQMVAVSPSPSLTLLPKPTGQNESLFSGQPSSLSGTSYS